MNRRSILQAAAAAALLAMPSASWAQDTVKIGLILPMTGQQASTGKQIEAAVELYMAAERRHRRRQEDRGDPQGRRRGARQHQAHRAGADRQRQGGVHRRLRHHADGACRRPAGHRSQGAVELVMAAGTSIITERSPYIVRTSFTLPQSSVIIADWAAKNGIKKVVTMVSDYAPGADAEKSFTERFTAGRRHRSSSDQGAARQPRLRAVPAARRRRQARRASSCSCRPARAAPS